MFDWSTVTAFDWDAGNASKSVRKHGVSCKEAEEMFGNLPLVVMADPSHSRQELRFRALGRTRAGRLLHAAFTLRDGTRLRPISIRPMNQKEKVIYEKETR